MTRSAAKRSNGNARAIAAHAIRDSLVEMSVLRDGAFTAELSRQLAIMNGQRREEVNWLYLASILNREYRIVSGAGTVRPRRTISHPFPLLAASAEYHPPFERVQRQPSRAERDFSIPENERWRYDQI